MDTVRGLTLWIAPAVLASLICTAAWHLLSGGSVADMDVALGFALDTVVFTVAGSALLTLMFVRMRSTPFLVRYFALLALGIGAGAVAMLWATSEFRLAGAIFGGTTAVIWCATHHLLYGPDVR